jgi:hypothetical protein
MGADLRHEVSLVWRNYGGIQSSEGIAVPVKNLILFIWLAALSACAAVLTPGQSSEQVMAARGSPQYRVTLESGERWIYQAAFAQENLTLEFDSRSLMLRQYNGLTDERFARALVRVWGQDEVRASFGPPTERSFVGWGEHRFEVWSYRYKQANTAPMMMGFHFGRDGKLAKSYAYADRAFDPGERTRE